MVRLMAGRDTNPFVSEAVFAIGGIAAARVARRFVNIVWVAAAGKAVPADPADPRVSTAEAVTFAMATGALVGVARRLVQRKANKFKNRRVGARA